MCLTFPMEAFSKQRVSQHFHPQNNPQLSPGSGFLLSAMDKEFSDLRESLWRRTSSPADRVKTAGQPDLQAEARLTEALTRLPDAPVASNFTSRVLAAIDLDERQTVRTQSRSAWNWRALFPRFAVACAVLMFAGISIQHYEVSAQRYALVKNVAMVATSRPMPSVDALENLDAIQRMGQSSHADGELLADLQ